MERQSLEILRDLREGLGLTQEQFGSELGISRQYYYRIERGLEVPSKIVIKKLMEFYNKYNQLVDEDGSDENINPLKQAREELGLSTIKVAEGLSITQSHYFNIESRTLKNPSQKLKSRILQYYYNMGISLLEEEVFPYEFIDHTPTIPLIGDYHFKSPEETVLEKEAYRMFLNKIGSLNQKHQTIIDLYLFEGYSYREIGKIVNLSPERIRQILEENTNKLKKHISRQI